MNSTIKQIDASLASEIEKRNKLIESLEDANKRLDSAKESLSDIEQEFLQASVEQLEDDSFIAQIESATQSSKLEVQRRQAIVTRYNESLEALNETIENLGNQRLEALQQHHSDLAYAKAQEMNALITEYESKQRELATIMRDARSKAQISLYPHDTIGTSKIKRIVRWGKKLSVE